MSYAEQVRDPSLALNPPQGKQSAVNWWWWIVASIVALLLIGIYRPQWLAKFGIHLGGSSGLGGINPHGWV